MKRPEVFHVKPVIKYYLGSSEEIFQILLGIMEYGKLY